MKEVKLGRFAGPFKDPPFKYFVQSPIGLVPKDGGKDTRLIFHLSYPRSGMSINSETPEELCTVEYPDFCEAIQRCLEEIQRHGKYSIAKSDMKSAFRNLCMKVNQFCLLVMYAISPIDGRKYWFCDKCLPFGASISCKIFQEFSNSIAHITMVHTGKVPINYLDDYFFTAFLRTLCNDQVNAFLQICSRINFPVSLDKTFWVTESLTFLSFLIDTVKQFVSIPVDKVQRAVTLIAAITSRKSRKVKVGELQKLCSFLNFLCRCIVPGRAFTQRLYSHFNSSMPKHYHVRVNEKMSSNLEMWLQFLKEPSVLL